MCHFSQIVSDSDVGATNLADIFAPVFTAQTGEALLVVLIASVAIFWLRLVPRSAGARGILQSPWVSKTTAHCIVGFNREFVRFFERMDRANGSRDESRDAERRV